MQSVDFFTPVVNDPYNFGRITAANALSDIYAMGASPLTALNIVGFPPCLSLDVLADILKGGAEAVAEAGAVIVGGHTVEDDEPKYGLAITGLVDPRKMITTVGCRPGDQLVLTKPLGTGILATALKGEVLTEKDMADAIAGMSLLNREASRVMMEVGVSACTDITGFGLIGHALEMAEASEVGMVIDSQALPAYPQVFEMAHIGLIPVGSYRNRQYYLPRVDGADQRSHEIIDLLADPQTSGGLLISVAAEKTGLLREKLEATGCGAFLIGHIEEGPKGRMKIC